jgi:hypothetical protein
MVLEFYEGHFRAYPGKCADAASNSIKRWLARRKVLLLCNARLVDADHPAPRPPLPLPLCLTFPRARRGLKSIGSRSDVWPPLLRPCRARSEWSSGPPRQGAIRVGFLKTLQLRWQSAKSAPQWAGWCSWLCSYRRTTRLVGVGAGGASRVGARANAGSAGPRSLPLSAPRSLGACSLSAWHLPDR